MIKPGIWRSAFAVVFISLTATMSHATKATADEQRACADDMNRWLAEGKLKARIDRVMPLADAAAAHRLQEENTLAQAGTLAGKIVLKP